MAKTPVDKPIVLPEKCEKHGGHRWIIKDKKYICEYCHKESESFKELKALEDSLPHGSIGS